MFVPSPTPMVAFQLSRHFQARLFPRPSSRVGSGVQTMQNPPLASFPGLHGQLLSLAVGKAGGRPGWIYHVMRAAADIMFSLFTSGLVLPLSLFFP